VAKVLAAVRPVFQQSHQARAEEELLGPADRRKDRFRQVSAVLVEAEEQIDAQMDFPAEHWRQASNTNHSERLNRGINRRTGAVGIFPTEKSRTQLISAVLCEENDEWMVSRKYMSRHCLERIYRQSTADIEAGIIHAVVLPTSTER